MSEVRLIDANALEKALDAWAVVLDKPHLYSREDALFVIQHHYSITPESLGWRKVVHGRWENTVKWWQGGSAWKRCSVCGIISEKTRYCRNCGARMIEKTDCPHQG